MYSAAFSAIRRVGERYYLLGSLAGQYAQDDLPSSVLYQIGGLGSVRGYQRGAVAGASGYTASLEFHRQLPYSIDLFLFADHGRIRDDSVASESISSLGIGFSWRPRGWFSASADVARAFDEPVLDQDDYRANFRVTFSW